MTRERKIYIVIGGLAVLGLGIDRVLIGTDLTDLTPASAAGVAAASAADMAGLDDLEALMAPLPTAGGGVAQHLRDVAQRTGQTPSQMRDAFTPAASWTGEKPNTLTIYPHEVVRLFGETHTLDAVMTIEGVDYAVVDGRHMLAVGDRFDGLEVASIADQSVVFRLGHAQVELTLEPNAR